MIRHMMMQGTALSSFSTLRAPDDGAGTGNVSATTAPGTATATDGHNGVGAVGNVQGASAVAGVVKDAGGAPVDRADATFDGLRARVASLETEIDRLNTTVSGLEDAATRSGGSADASAIRRLETVLADVFGRELAEYDAKIRAAPPVTVLGS